MSEHIAPGIHKAPESLPSYITSNLGLVAKKHGYEDHSDGITSIGDIELLTPEEAIFCDTSYERGLIYLVNHGKMPSAHIVRKLQTKFTLGTPSVNELATAIFNFEDGIELGRSALPIMKELPHLAMGSLNSAQSRGYIDMLSCGTKILRDEGVFECNIDLTWKNRTYNYTTRNRNKKQTVLDAHLGMYATIVDIDPKTIESPFPRPLSPIDALKSYTNRYGGSPLPQRNTHPNKIRERIKQRYIEDLEGKIYYPDPLHVLGEFYAIDTWQDKRKSHKQIVSRGVTLRHHDAPDRVDQYQFFAEGPSALASHQAAARLILEHIGATDIQLL